MRLVSHPALRRAALLATALVPALAHAQEPVLLETLNAPDPDVSSESFGYTLEILGDVNADGVADLLVGGRNAEIDGVFGAGRLYVLDGTTADPLYAVVSPSIEDSGFSEYLAALGDVDGDGVPDFVASAAAEGLDDEGAAYVFSGADGALIRELISPTPAPFAYFGSSVSAAGDLTGDGVQEILVGAPVEERDPETFSGGRVHVYDGASGAVVRSLQAPFELGQSGSAEYFGKTVALLDDLDGDGVPEHAVQTRNTFPGRVDLFSGADGSPLDFLLASPEAIDFGLFLGTYPDGNGDGVDEILVGAPGGFFGPPGEVDLYNGATRALIRSYLPPAPEDGGFGTSVAVGADLDGRGAPDLFVGAPGTDVDGAPNVGRAYVVSTETGAILATLDTPDPSFFGVYGYDLTAFDLGGDGINELLVGAPQEAEGRIYVYGRAGLAVGLVPADPPVVIPAEGGRFTFTATLANRSGQAQTFQAWTEATYPDGSTRLALGPIAVVLGPGQIITRALVQQVPASLPPGPYTYTGYVGAYPDGAVASDAFPGVKLPAALAGRTTAGEAEEWAASYAEGGAPVAAGDVWTTDGPTAEPQAEARAPSGAFALPVVGPNPASGRTTIAFALAAASEVRVSLYDVLGREVASVEAGTLAAGSHQLGLNVGSLPSGVYVWRLAAGTHAETGRLTVAR